MSQLGKVRIGHKAPDFHCDAVIKGLIEEQSLSSYISPSNPKWLILLFIPAAFSFVCPTEVLAFQNCLDEFHDRNCDVVFVSVDTKHSLWHWQNVPRQYGGLGQIDIALLSDASHKMSRDYGVLIEEEGVCLRGLFILDDKAVVQQVTLNNLTVGRSVLEALRLLEAFQAVAKHGVLCPIDWKPSTNTSDTINTISNTLTESYDERLANLQKEFGDILLTDLDVKHSTAAIPSRMNKMGTVEKEEPEEEEAKKEQRQGRASTSISKPKTEDEVKDKPIIRDFASPSPPSSNPTPAPSSSPTPAPSSNTTPVPIPTHRNDCLPRRVAESPSNHTMPAPGTAPATPMQTPSTVQSLAQTTTRSSFPGTARHSRGHTTASHAPHSHATLHKHNTYTSRGGSHIVLEFADPTLSPSHSPSPSATPALAYPSNNNPYPSQHSCLNHNSHRSSSTPSPGSPNLSRSGGQASASTRFIRAPTPPLTSGVSTPGNVTSPRQQTRMQATFEAIKMISAGLSSPRIDFNPKKNGANAQKESRGNGGEKTGERGQEGEWGYFDVVPEVVEA